MTVSGSLVQVNGRQRWFQAAMKCWMVAVPLGAGVGDPAGGDLECGEQGGGAVPDVVRRVPLGRSRSDGKPRGGPLQRLDLRLLIDAEHHRLLRWMQVQPEDVADLALQGRVGGELEGLR